MVSRYTGNTGIIVAVILAGHRENNRPYETVPDAVRTLSVTEHETNPIACRLLRIRSNGVAAYLIQDHPDFIYLENKVIFSVDYGGEIGFKFTLFRCI